MNITYQSIALISLSIAVILLAMAVLILRYVVIRLQSSLLDTLKVVRELIDIQRIDIQRSERKP